MSTMAKMPAKKMAAETIDDEIIIFERLLLSESGELNGV